VDVDPGTFTMDPAMLPGALSPRTRAVVPVHLYGQPADLGPILAFAADHGLRVIEDCAQTHGALWRAAPGSPWRRAGTAGDAAAFSFYPTKNLGAVGDGGCVTTNDPDLAETVRRLREYGWRERFISERPGWNSRLDELQAAILRVKLRHLDAWNEARGERAAAYDRRLAGSRAVPPQRAPDRTHVFHQYVVRVPDRDRVRAALAAAGVESAIHYPLPIHLQPAYRRLDRPGFLSVTEDLCRSILSLPMHPHLPPDDVAFVAAELQRATARAD
jgi:dTDP-4-amino-4,6-dideoxygalactose transaminase